MGFSDRISRASGSMMNRFAEHTAILGPGISVPVIYDAAFRLAEAYEGQVETSSPACSMTAADIARLAVQHGTQLSILHGPSLVGDFEVIGVEPDGLGLTRLILTRAT